MNLSHRKYRTWRAAQISNAAPYCIICGQPVDKTLQYPHPLSPSLDHRTPRSRGGNVMDPTNVGLAHLNCNSRRGNNPLPRRHSRNW